MLFVLICEDKPDSVALRLANREKHLAYAGSLGDRIRMAGPMLAEDGETMIGSLFVIEADSRQDVLRINAEDPYTLAGLFETVTVRAFRQVIPAA